MPTKGHDRAIWIAQLLAVIVPVTVAIVAIASKRWGAPSDWGVELMRTHDVGGVHSPLVGPHGRFGWAHPGPMLFYVEAPFVKLFGATGMLIGAGVINLVSLVTVMVLARRRGGVALTSVVGLICLVLCHSLTFSFLIDPWNPWITTLPFFAVLFAAWSIADGDRWCLPVAVVAASFVVQTHVSYGLVTLVTVTASLVIVVFRNRRQLRALTIGSTRPTLVAVGLSFVLWLPPVIQQLTHLDGGGNLSAIARYFLTGDRPTSGRHYGVRALGFQLSPIGPWLTGNEPSFVAPNTVSIPTYVFVTVVVVLGGLALWRGNRSAGHLVMVCVAAVFGGWVSLSNITGTTFMYLMRWTWAVAALLVISLWWSARALLERGGPSQPSRTADRQPTGHMRPAKLATAALAIFAVSLLPSARAAHVPFATGSRTVLTLSDRAQPSLRRSQTYLIRWHGTDLVAGLSVGIAATLALRGYRIIWDPDIEPTVGAQRIALPGESIVLMQGYNITGTNGTWRPPVNETVVVRYRSPGTDPQLYVLTLGPYVPS